MILTSKRIVIFRKQIIVDFSYQDTVVDRFAKKLGASMAQHMGVNIKNWMPGLH